MTELQRDERLTRLGDSRYTPHGKKKQVGAVLMLRGDYDADIQAAYDLGFKDGATRQHQIARSCPCPCHCD